MRVRLRFAKLGKVRFTSHRDVVRLWERGLRRALVPVAYSAGFRPRPKLSFGLALSTGHESVAEYLDAELDAGAGTVEVAELPERLSAELPVGIDVLAAAGVEEGAPSLQEQVQTCSWRIEALDLLPERAERLVDAALAADELVITRSRKGRDVTDDLRPALRSVAVARATAGGTELEAELSVHPRSVRPAELLVALDPGLRAGRVLRTAQWIWSDGARDEPLVAAVDLGASRAPLAAASVTRRDPDVRPRTRGRQGHAALAPEPFRATAAPRGAPIDR